MDSLLIVTDAEIHDARKLYDKTENDMKQDVAIIQEWLKQQSHLPDNEGKNFMSQLGCFFLKCL